MYYKNYEDYMRNVLGYMTHRQDIYEAYNYLSAPNENSQNSLNNINYSNEIINLYPEIYKVVNPMVCKICDLNTKPIGKELIDEMAQEIYSNLEVQPEYDTIVNIKVNTQSNIEKNNRTTNMVKSPLINNNMRSKNEPSKKDILNSTEKRESRAKELENSTLKDLIRILILNRLLENGIQENRPPRPNYWRIDDKQAPINAQYMLEDENYNNYFKL